MNFDTEFTHDGKRISNEEVFFIKRARIDRDKNRSKDDFHFTVEFLRRHSTEDRAEIRTRSKTTYIKAHYQRNCIVLLLIIQGVAVNFDFFSASWLQDVHDVKIETVTFLYRLFSFNKRDSSQKKVQRALKEELFSFLIDRKSWNYWYRKLSEESTEVEDFVNLRERTVFVLRKDSLAITVRRQLQIRSKYFMFEILNESIGQSVIIIDSSVINISVIAELITELFQIARSNPVMFTYEQLESFQFIFGNSETSVFEQSVFGNYASKPQTRTDISRVKRGFGIVLKFHTHIFRRFNSVQSNSKNFFLSSHRHRNANGFFRQRRLYIDRQRNRQQEQIIQRHIQHFMNNSNYTNLSVRDFFLSKHQSVHSNRFDELEYLRSKIRKLKRSF